MAFKFFVMGDFCPPTTFIAGLCPPAPGEGGSARCLWAAFECPTADLVWTLPGALLPPEDVAVPRPLSYLTQTVALILQGS